MEMNCAKATRKTWRLRSFKALHIFLVPSALQVQLHEGHHETPKSAFHPDETRLHVLFVDQNLVRTQLALELASDWFLLQHVKIVIECYNIYSVS